MPKNTFILEHHKDEKSGVERIEIWHYHPDPNYKVLEFINPTGQQRLDAKRIVAALNFYMEHHNGLLPPTTAVEGQGEGAKRGSKRQPPRPVAGR